MDSALVDLVERCSRSAPFRDLLGRSEGAGAGTRLRFGGVCGSARALLVAALEQNLPRQIIVVLSDRGECARTEEDMRRFAPDRPVRVYHAEEGGRTGDPAAEDADALRAMLQEVPPVVLVTPEALLRPLPAPALLAEHIHVVDAGDHLPMELLLGRLQGSAFERKEFVERRGEMAVRGGILDVFPFAGEHPVRMEFNGDEVESIREFDPSTQRSLRPLLRASIAADPRSIRIPAGGAAALADYVTPDALVLRVEPELAGRPLEEGGSRAEDLERALRRWACVELRASAGRPGDPALDTVPQPAYNGSVRHLREDIRELGARGTTVIIACDSHTEQARLEELLAGEEGAERGAVFTTPSLHAGFVSGLLATAVLTEHQIFNRERRNRRRPRPGRGGLSRRDVSRLTRGDFVVHQDYGIGTYDGLTRIRLPAGEQEVLRLLYAEKDVLYVNIAYLGKVQKFSSREGHIPRLTRLGRPEWERLKERARGRIKDIARDLIRLYSRRRQSPGFAFAPDAVWQKELEASFMYEDTFDQAKATREVKEDMEAPHPMDRLICGDVGFGKTEVAVRASFKAVLSGKQVAVLVPTTILALQHYQTFTERLARYGTAIGMFSRLKTRREQEHILQEVREGRVDVVIGTHRLLSGDVRFRNLGLLIIDEEHRFGVASKEKLRALQASVDTLTLTATPIPRTLHFSLLGARDLSLIATPPRNRLPIHTEMAEYDERLIREAILREVDRGGQVFFVHSRVTDIESVAEKLRGLMPGLRVDVAHGQMRPRDLENAMLRFLERRADVLVCTKIIESGVDIPSVNTMIVNRADRFGMAELYQLRGRVGRSNVQAYAYLITPPAGSMPRETLLRLQALEEFTELGSGFHLAMRDLETRGAGNLLGAEQTGFMESMGFETYSRILDEAVAELKREEFPELFPEAGAHLGREPVTVELHVSALLPESYVPGEAARLDLYRALAAVRSSEQLEEAAEELRDRFGPLPEEAEHLLQAVRIRLASERTGFRRVVSDPRRVELHLPPAGDAAFYESGAFQRLMERVGKLRTGGAALRTENGVLKLLLPVSPQASPREILSSTLKTIEALTSP
ncbi:MAG: transcription-repair coupling factor [Bacteroidota bacterium]